MTSDERRGARRTEGPANDRDEERIDLRTWMAQLAALPGMSGLSVSPAEERALLELTRLAAHRSDRIAAPITAYAVGLALAPSSAADRARALASIVAELRPPD